MKDEQKEALNLWGATIYIKRMTTFKNCLPGGKTNAVGWVCRAKGEPGSALCAGTKPRGVPVGVTGME